MDSSLIHIVPGPVLLILGIGSIMLAALSAAFETAIAFSNKSYLRHLSESGNAAAKTAIDLLEQGVLHATLLLFETFFIVFSVVLVTVIVIESAAHAYWVIGIAILLMTILIVFFAKLLPKSIVCRNPDRFLLISAPVIQPVIRLLVPVSQMFARLADSVAGKEAKNMWCGSAITEDDIKAMINLSEERGSLKEEEKELLHKVFEFGDTLASEAMRPRTDIVSVPATMTLQDVLSLVSDFGYSRYPVIEETVDTVIGILYIKDILVAMASGEVKREDEIQRFIRPAYFIPENKRVSELLAEMQRERFQIAIVIDEYGGTAGLVTLEDLIEKIVGSIHDELEAEERDVQIVDEKNFVVSGQSALDEVNELLDTSLQSNDFNTLGGFLFGLFGRMPRVGEQLKYKNLRFEVLDLEGRKISKIKITKL